MKSVLLGWANDYVANVWPFLGSKKVKLDYKSPYILGINIAKA